VSLVMDLAGGSPIPWFAAGLALVAVAVYAVIASPARPAGYEAPPKPVLAVAAPAYLVGGVLILVGDRRLLVLGAVLNPLVLAAYTVAAIKGHVTVDGLSLASKAAQVGLEVALLWLALRSTAPAGDLG